MPRSVLTLRAAREEARGLVDAAMREAGWVGAATPDGDRLYTRGSKPRTVLLGALAGRAFYLEVVSSAVERGPGITEVDYRWGEHHGLLLGGTLGRRAAEREHERTLAAVRRHLEDTGALLGCRSPRVRS